MARAKEPELHWFPLNFISSLLLLFVLLMSRAQLQGCGRMTSGHVSYPLPSNKRLKRRVRVESGTL